MQTVSVERAGILLSAVAIFGPFRCGFGEVNALRGFEYTFITAVNDLLSVFHAPVANFDGIPVEDFSKFMIFRKVFIY